MKEKLKNFAWGYVILFAILAAIGVLCICFHDTLPYVALGIGAIITLYGIIYGVLALANKERGPKFAFRVTIAVCSIVAGVITMVFCKKAIDILTALMGLFLIVDGSFKLQSAAISKRYKSVGWWLLLVPSLASIIGGFLVTRFESDGTDNSVSTISIMLGIVLIVDALSNLFSAFFAGKLISASPEGSTAKDETKAPDAESKDKIKALPEAVDATDAKPESEGDTVSADEKPEAIADKPEADTDAPRDTKVEAEDEPEADTDALTEDKPEADADAPREDKPEED